MSESEASVDSEVDRLYDRVVARAKAYRGRPILLEALWDGDTQGWMLCLFVTLRRRFGGRTRESIGCLRYGGDFRLFAGSVPPWPESEVAKQLGVRLEREFGCELWFPSPNEPDDHAPAYAERDQAIACAACKKLIIPTDSPYRPKDICYSCHLRREHDARLRREPSDNEDPGCYYVAVEGQSSSYSAEPFLELIEADLSPPLGDHRLEPETVALLAERAASEVERLLETHDPARDFDRIPPIRLAWRGRELELEPRMTASHRPLFEALHLAQFIEDARASGLAIEVFTNAGIKIRDGHVLGQLILHAGQASRAELRQRHAREFGSEQAVDEAVARLLQVGCVSASEDMIRVTRKGEVLGNSPAEWEE
jgi:hypothetical protein